jgi:triosephosphate isomerase (TIM)
MTSKRRPLVAANWKMNGSLTANEDWVNAFVPKAVALRTDIVVCAPFVYLCTLGRSLAPAELGAQDVSERGAGAFTGDVSAEMLADVG